LFQQPREFWFFFVYALVYNTLSKWESRQHASLEVVLCTNPTELWREYAKYNNIVDVPANFITDAQLRIVMKEEDNDERVGMGRDELLEEVQIMLEIMSRARGVV
jgi:hypothetical protein